MEVLCFEDFFLFVSIYERLVYEGTDLFEMVYLIHSAGTGKRGNVLQLME